MDHLSLPSLNPGDLLLQWQTRADWLQQYGDPNSARLWRLAAVELEHALEAFGAEALTVTENGGGLSPAPTTIVRWRASPGHHTLRLKAHLSEEYYSA